MEKKAFTGRNVQKKYVKSGQYEPEIPFPLPGIKHLLKNTFPLYEKTASSGKEIKEDGLHQEGNCSFNKLVLPNFNNGLQQLKKSSEQKYAVSTRQKISFR